ncbi:coiled-coil domain-containing protein 39 [Episyrphus balteatus]|uniref:coiled-coil domain-containing protein 39 n=1 Tax=Episyrphus balteatus TaxID=286459 RepID=UPI002485039A|nr:coiled-coil domain-containing protein 39 [Episyrphus balteatus]
MSKNYIHDIALSMGLCLDKGLPMANEENKQLLLLIENLNEEKNLLQTNLQNFNERAQRLVTHAKNSEVTHAQNMKLIYAFQSDMRIEQHLYKIAERESSKLKIDLKEMQQEEAALCQYEDTTESDIKKRNKTIFDLSNRINWLKAALVEWRQCMNEGNEANKLIEKYCKDDQKKYLDVETKRRLLQNTINKERKRLIDFVEEQKSLEQNLDRTANLYRSSHAERRDMVDTWKTAVCQMNQREQDILQTEAEFERILGKCLKKESKLKMEENKLDEIIANNAEVEESIQQLNDETSDLKDRLQRLLDLVALRDNEVDILRKELQGLANRVQQQRQKNRQDVQRKSDKELELSQCIEGNNKLKKSHENLNNKNVNAQERLRVLEDMIQSEEHTKEKLSQETNRMNDLLYRTQQHLGKFKDDEKILEVENGGIRLNITAMEKNIKETQKYLSKQTESHYDMSLKAVLLERRIAKIKGTVVDPQEERQKLMELSKLETYFNEASKTLQALQSQSTKLESDMRNLTICFNNDMKEIEAMNFRIKEAQLYCEGGIKKISVTTRSNQEKIVELSILKMRVNEIENQITQCQDRAYNLDRHRLQMSKNIKERMVEANAQYDLMYLKRKHLLEELSTLKCDIGDRMIKIEATKARYELTSKLLGTNDDGSLVTATQMKIENAQEKQMLLEQGNALNANVLKAEQEIKAMEHTLALMNGSNEMYRRNFEELDEDAEDLQILKNQQTEYCHRLAQLKTLRNKISQVERQIESIEMEKEVLEETVQELLRKRLDNNELLTKVHKELLDQTVKIQRANREVKTAWKTARQRSFDSVFLSIYNKELDLQELEKRNTTALQLFADLIDNDLELAPHTTKMLYAKGIECPKARKCRTLGSWRGELSELSFASSKEIQSSRSSGSINSLAKMTTSTRPSVVSIDFPTSNLNNRK